MFKCVKKRKLVVKIKLFNEIYFRINGIYIADICNV